MNVRAQAAIGFRRSWADAPVGLFAGMFVGLIFGNAAGLGGVAAVVDPAAINYLFDPIRPRLAARGGVRGLYLGTRSPGSSRSTGIALHAAPTAIEGPALAKQGKLAGAGGRGSWPSMVGDSSGAGWCVCPFPRPVPIVLMLGTPELLMFALVGPVPSQARWFEEPKKALRRPCLGLLLGVRRPRPRCGRFSAHIRAVWLLDGWSPEHHGAWLYRIAEAISMLAHGGGR